MAGAIFVAPRLAGGVLLAHFDPNLRATLFQDGAEDGGTSTATAFGDAVGWITGAASATPGGAELDNFIDVQQGLTPPTYTFHPGGGILEFDGNDNLLGFENDTGFADGASGALSTNVIRAVVAGRAATGGSGLDHFLDLRGGGATNGLSLRYNRGSGELEGVVNAEVVVSAPVRLDEFFVANLVWNGANATLSVATPAGTVSDAGTPADTTAIAHDRFRIGEDAGNSRGVTGFIGDVYLYNDASDQSGRVSQPADQYLLVPEVIIDRDRDRGNISLTSPAGGYDLTSIIGYTLSSASGALAPDHWLSIAENYDAGSPGPNQVDPDNNWFQFSINPDDRTNLTEFEINSLGGADNGEDFVAGSSTSFGDAWAPYYREDVEMLLVENGDAVLPLFVKFVGNTGEPFSIGDLDENGAVELADYLLMNNAFLAANPGANAFSYPTTTPEPSTLLTALLAVAGLVWSRHSRGGTHTPVLAGCAAAVLFSLSRPADAPTVFEVDSEHLATDADGLTSSGQLLLDVSGNSYDGFVLGGAGVISQIAAAGGPRTFLDTRANNAYAIRRDGRDFVNTGEPTRPDPWITPSPDFALNAANSYTIEAVLKWDEAFPNETAFDPGSGDGGGVGLGDYQNWRDNFGQESLPAIQGAVAVAALEPTTDSAAVMLIAGATAATRWRRRRESITQLNTWRQPPPSSTLQSPGSKAPDTTPASPPRSGSRVTPILTATLTGTPL
ncbi:MAG: hypothetical protein AAGB00_07820 [Planctomycetota bacterium]